MPTMRKQVNKGKFSSYGTSVFATKTKNTEYFSQNNRRTPTLRGAFPTTIKTSSYDGKPLAYVGYKSPKATNSQIKKNNMVAVSTNEIKKTSNVLQNRQEKKVPTFVTKLSNADKKEQNLKKTKVKQTVSTKKVSKQKQEVTKKPIFEGTAVKKPELIREKTNFFVVPGSLRTKRLFHTTALSPMILTAAKIAFVSVIVIAIVAFVRVGLSSATISAGISSQQLSTQIQDELEAKNALEVQDSTLGNSSKIRSEAMKMQLITPKNVEHIKLGEDIVAYDDHGNVSMVESLNRVARNGK